MGCSVRWFVAGLMGATSLLAAGLAGAAEISDVTISIPGTGTASQRDGKLTIKDAAGKVIYSKEKFSIDKHLEDVPADFRPTITILMKSSGGGGILGLAFLKPDPGVEVSVDDLLEKAAGKQD